MIRATLIILCLWTLLFACKGPDAELTAEGANFFGEQINADGAVTLSEVKKPNDGVDTVNVLIKGTINEVCQAKGCWMTLAGDRGEEVFVRFKDYGFFVPKDADGLEAVVRGKLFTTETSVDELRHYAEDKGQSKEEIAAITEPKKELRMMADGVIIYN